MTKQDLINELKRELAYRRQHWRPIGSGSEFVSHEQTTRFAAMQRALEVFEAMHAAEFQIIVNRIQRLKQEAEKQTTLFK